MFCFCKIEVFVVIYKLRRRYRNWRNHFSVTELSSDHEVVTEKHTMGGAKTSAAHLTITPIKEGNAWKIRKLEGIAPCKFR
jgi:hypothetical protein